jgi:hypothetical protein
LYFRSVLYLSYLLIFILKREKKIFLQTETKLFLVPNAIKKRKKERKKNK